MLQERIGVDLFIFNNDYFDLPSVSGISTVTGGSVYFYKGYIPHLHAEKLHYEISRALTRFQAFDVVMRLRSSPGLTICDLFSSGVKKSTGDIDFSVFDADKSLTFSVRQEEKIASTEAYLQLGVLYTTLNGERIIRVINTVIRIANEPTILYKSIDTAALSLFFLRKAILGLLSASVPQVRDQLYGAVLSVLRNYKQSVAKHRRPI
jgi:protein transport protein SEC24